MYMARIKKNNLICFIIRQSYRDGDCYRSRDLFDLGTDPSSYIVYPGGNAYYLDPVIQEGLDRAGVKAELNLLDDLFFEFLVPDIQRVITGFDRRGRRAHANSSDEATSGDPVHLFDKRRFHFLRYGSSRQRYLSCVPERYFNPLRRKSRDEIEHYFMAQEAKLHPQELPVYVSVIFALDHFIPDGNADQSLQLGKDAFFVDRLCSLHADATFWSGMTAPVPVTDYLARYAIAYFDLGAPMKKPAWLEYIEAFINAHRRHQPPAKVRESMDRAANLFGIPWKDLKALDRTGLTRLYRRLALQHHPDQGGNGDTFLELTRAYQVLLKQKPKAD